MKKLVLFLGICCSLILLASCGTQSTEQTNSTTSTPENGGVNTEETTTDSPEVIKIGVLAPISGGAAAYGEDAVNAYTQVVEAYNALNTPKIELVVEDSKCNGKDSVLAYNKLVNVDKVQAIAGATCSSATIPAAKITQTSKIPMISPTSSAPSISDIGPYIYRYYNDLDAANAVVNYLQGKGATKIGILVENTDYGVGYANAVKERFTGEVVFDEKFDSDEKDFALIAKKVANISEDIDALIFVPNNENSALGILLGLQKEGNTLAQLTKNGKLIGSEGIISDGVIEQVGDDFNGTLSTKIIDDMEMFNDSGKQFMETYTSQHPVQSSELFVTLEGETMSLIADAIKDGNYTSEFIQNYLQSVHEGNPREGFFGSYYFKASGDAVGLNFLMAEIQNGKLETLK